MKIAFIDVKIIIDFFCLIEVVIEIIDKIMLIRDIVK